MNEESTFEIKIPTRASRKTRIRVKADNHLLALKIAVKVLRASFLPLEVKPEGGRWKLLSTDGKAVGYIRKIEG